MKRTINNTSRKRIEFVDFNVMVSKQPGVIGHVAQLEWKLDYLGLPEQADVVAVISGRGLDRRFELGRVGTGTGSQAFAIGETEENPSVRVELFVSEWQGQLRRILASSASRAIVMGDISGGSQSLLPVKLRSDLVRLWNLDYSTGTPILEVSNKVLGAANAPWFKLAVLPQVLKNIYLQLVIDSQTIDEDVEKHWIEYFKMLDLDVEAAQETYTPGDFNFDSIADLFDESEMAVDLFTQKFNLLQTDLDNGESGS